MRFCSGGFRVEKPPCYVRFCSGGAGAGAGVCAPLKVSRRGTMGCSKTETKSTYAVFLPFSFGGGAGLKDLSKRRDEVLRKDGIDFMGCFCFVAHAIV